jgi:coenzyme PQQ biosynthesis protein PqqD
MSEDRPKLAKKARLKWDEREKKFMLLYPERGLLLNSAAAEIVKLCDGAHSATDIIDALVLRMTHESAEKQADRAVIERDVNELLAKLRERKLLE